MTNIVSIHKVKKAFSDKVILKDVSLDVTEGEIYGLLGVNGAGKSTLIDCILGIKDINSGEIRVLGEKPCKKNKRLFAKIGVQFQQTNYQDKIKVNELCTVTSSYYKTPKDWRKLLQLFSLEGKESRYVNSLSGGEKQKLSILLTIIPNPKIVFLDELTTGLDTYARRLIWEQLLQLKSEGLTIFLTSHYMDEVELLCDRVGILKDGKIMREGTVSELIATSGEKTLEDAFLRYTKEENHETF